VIQLVQGVGVSSNDMEMSGLACCGLGQRFEDWMQNEEDAR